MPPLLEDSEIEVILSRVDELISWANDIKEYALQQAISGKEWTGWKLVEGRSNRRYTSEDSVSKAAYAGSYFVNANATSAPGIVDADRNPILTRSEVYSAVFGRASISFYAFNSSGNKGIACGLNNLQKLRDGEPLGGKASAESDFATDDDDDFLD